MKALKFMQYIYLVFFVILTYEAINLWSVDRNKAYLFFGFSILALFMFFFRRKYMKRFEDRGNL